MIKASAAVFICIFAPVIACAQGQALVHIGVSNAASFVADVTIPDGTVMSPGQSFTKTWRMANSGTTNWVGYSLAFVSGAQMNAPSSVPVSATPAGAAVDISVPMTAPNDAGTHQGYWQLRTADGEPFGQRAFVLVRVQSATYEGRRLKEWEKDLQAPSPTDREKAVHAMSGFGPEAAPALIKVFRDDDNERVRFMALAALVESGAPTREAIATLLRAATDPSPVISMGATMLVQEALPSRIGPEAVPAIVAAMADASPAGRQLAIQLLAGIGPPAKVAVPALREVAARDPEPQLRGIAAEALKRIDLRGAVVADRYTSARALFSVPVPKASNFADVPFAVRDSDVNRTGRNDVDVVAFEVKDFGEVLIAGARRMSDDVSARSQNEDTRTGLSSLADELLRSWRAFPVTPKVAEDAYSRTSHGEALIRVYRAEKGSLLFRAQGGKPGPSDTFDTIIALVVARDSDYCVYAIAEHDAAGVSLGADVSREDLKRRAQAFFASIVINR